MLAGWNPDPGLRAVSAILRQLAAPPSLHHCVFTLARQERLGGPALREG